ncbi:MAG: leucine-rich repeat protein, partial [Treponema sp.]|nr:leucine-rich repeat protein [Treponema sp.]
IKGTTVVRYTGAEADVRIPNGVTIIGESAFEGCTSLESVTIPASVTSIGYRAFDSLTEVKYGGTAEQWKQIDIGSDAFPSGVKIYDKEGKEITE